MYTLQECKRTEGSASRLVLLVLNPNIWYLITHLSIGESVFYFVQGSLKDQTFAQESADSSGKPLIICLLPKTLVLSKLTLPAVLLHKKIIQTEVCFRQCLTLKRTLVALNLLLDFTSCYVHSFFSGSCYHSESTLVIDRRTTWTSCWKSCFTWVCGFDDRFWNRKIRGMG